MDKTLNDILDDLKPYVGFTDTNVGEMLVYKHDTIVSSALALYGEYTYSESEVLATWLTPTSTHLDIGTNIGYHALAINKLVGCNVLAFEPQKNHFAMAAYNTQNKTIKVHNCAVGKIEGSIRITDFDPNVVENYGIMQVSSDDNGTEVPIVTVDSLNLEACSSMKIDVEGYEFDVLEGANNTIDKFRPIIQYEATEFSKDDETWRKCHAFLEAKDYKQYWIVSKVKPSGENYKKSDLNPYENLVVANILAIPTEIGQPDFLAPATRDENWEQFYHRIIKYKLVF